MHMCCSFISVNFIEIHSILRGGKKLGGPGSPMGGPDHVTYNAHLRTHPARSCHVSCLKVSLSLVDFFASYRAYTEQKKKKT